MGLRSDLGQSAGYVALQTTLWMALVAAALYASIAPGVRGLGLHVNTLRAVGASIPLLVVAFTFAWPPSRLPALAWGSAAVGFLPCFAMALMAALPTAWATSWTLGRAFPTAAPLRGAIVGAASGLVAFVAMVFKCPSRAQDHILVAHALPLLFAMVLGAVLAKGFNRPSAHR
jgi:hypothetical protein